MSRWQRERIALGIDGQSACRRDAVGSVVVRHALPDLTLVLEADRVSQVTGAVAALLRDDRPRRPKVRAVVGDSLARYWTMQSPAGVRSLSELRAVASARCEQLLGANQTWRIAADWHPRHPFLCVALPEWLVTGLERAAPTVHIETPTYAALKAFAASGGQDSWLCVLSPGRSALLSVVRGRIRTVRVIAAPLEASLMLQLDQAAQELAREVLRSQLTLPSTVSWWHVGRQTTDTPIGTGGFSFRAQPWLGSSSLFASACDEAEAASAVAVAA